MTRQRLYWLLTFLFAVLFFWFFWQLEPTKPIENKVQLAHQITPDTLYFTTTQIIDPTQQNDDSITIKLSVVNPTNQEYSADDYYYRVVINRSYPDSPGFIIKDFSKNLGAGEHFEEEFSWQRLNNYMPNEEFKFRIHFNMYKRNKNGEPTLIASSTKLLKVTATVTLVQ